MPFIIFDLRSVNLIQMKKTLYILVIILCAFLQSSSTFSFEYSVESNALIADVMEELDLNLDNGMIQNNAPKFSNELVTDDLTIRNVYFDVCKIISNYLDAENGMFHIVTIGKLLEGIATIAVTIVIHQIEVLINLFLS